MESVRRKDKREEAMDRRTTFGKEEMEIRPHAESGNHFDIISPLSVRTFSIYI